MSKFSFVSLLLIGLILAGRSASACLIRAETDLHDVQYSDVVVIGSIDNYRVILDPAMRQNQKGIPGNSTELPKRPDRNSGFITDYARFDISVDEVLRGTAPKILDVTWDNSTFGEPEHMLLGPFLIALRYPSSRIPPFRGPSATVLPTPDPSALTVLQAPCAEPLIFKSKSMETGLIRRILASNPK